MSYPVSRRGRGFSLLELTVALVVAGVLGLLAGHAFSGAEGHAPSSPQEGRAETHAVREALRYFALANKRLPCPDQNADGREDCASPGESGFVPYLALGLEDAARERMRYAVYRGSGANDVTLLEERTGDREGQPDFRGYGDVIHALGGIPAVVAVSSDSHVRVAALRADGGSDCENATHPAFVLIAPDSDRDGDGDSRDGVNADITSCVASPLQSGSASYDDVVVAEAPGALIDWLFKHHVH
jgi:prepilin-type N-terminal cleavage/methylation domain-containing protein